jgi:hypothetical protein
MFCLTWADLHNAARTGDAETVEQSLRIGVAVDAADVDGLTALHKAAFYGIWDIAGAVGNLLWPYSSRAAAFGLRSCSGCWT